MTVARVMEDHAPFSFDNLDQSSLLVEDPPAGFVDPALDPGPDLGDFAQRLAQALRGHIGEERYDLWFDRKTRFTLAGDTLVVEAGHDFAVKWIQGKFRTDLQSSAATVVGRPLQVVVRMCAELAPRTSAGLPAAHAGTAPATAKSRTPVATPGTSNLNPNYTLQSFVVGPSNQMAYHAALRVAECAGRQFNPLFIHGHCGLGKTHLLQGICHRFAALSAKKWLYLTGEQFTNEYLEAIRQHRTDAFRRRIRGVQLLVIDDVHFLANKRATQEEFLHTFNQIDANGCQIVLASDCAPRQIHALSEQLSSRFVSGMVLRVDSPDLPTRLDILRRRVVRHGWNINDAVLMHIARTGTSSVREWEGLLLQVVAGVRLIYAGKGEDAGAMLATLRERTAMRGPVSVERIVTTVAEHFSLQPAEILGAGREKTVAAARALSMYLARQHSGMSFPEIGRAVGGKNHSTVIAACQRVEAMITGGQLLCWNSPAGPRHQSVSDALHELETAIRRAVSA